MNSVEGSTLPDGWREVKISDVSEFIRGITFKTNDAKNNYEDGLVGVYRTKNIQETLTLDDVYFLTKEHIRNDNKYLKKGDVLISSANSLELLGKCCKYIEMDYPASLGGFISCARVNSLMNADYFYYFFASDFNQRRMRSLANQTTGIANLPLKSVSELPISLPPLEEQKRIVAKIDGLFAKIDKAITLTEESLKQAKNLLPSVLKEVFEKGKADGWEEKEFGEVITILTDYHANGSYKVLKKNVELKDIEDYAWMIRSTDFEKKFKNSLKYIDKHAYDFMSKSQVYGNEIIMSKIGNAGIVYLMPSIDRPVSLAMNLFLIRLNENIVLPDFIFRFLKSNDGETQIKKRLKGATTKTITKDNVRNIIISYPNLKEQKKIVKKLNNLSEKAKQTQFKLEEQLAYLKQLKSSILSKAFKGEL